MSAYIQEDKITRRTRDGRLMRRFLRRLTPHKMKVALIILLLALSSFAGLAGPYLIHLGIDEGIARGNHGYLLNVVLIYLAFILCEFGLNAAKMIQISSLSQRFMLDLRLELFRHIQKLPINFFDRNPVGRLMTRITGDVEVLNELFTAGLVAIFGDIFTLTFIMVIMLIMDLRLALITFLVTPLLAIVTLFFRTRLRKNFRQIQKRIAAINAFLQERLAGMEVIQVFTKEDSSLGDFRNLNEAHKGSHMEAVLNFSYFFPLVRFVGTLTVAMLLLGGGRWVSNDTVSIGVLIAFIQYAQRFFRPLSDLSEKFNILQSSMASAERIFKLIDEVPEQDDPDDPVEVLTCRGDIRLDGVHFRYNPDEPVLRDVSLRVKPGQRVALVGYTGCGKSTLLSLLLRFYEPDAGDITLDGIPLGKVRMQDLRRQFALVLQDVFLFPGTIAENINLGDPAIDQARVEEVARAVGAHDFISRLPNGYQTVLQARGGGISTGQKQLIAFSRALAYDPAILLLDEATSSVDTATENLIEQGLVRLMSGRTSIVVAHRLSTVRHADLIYVMHQGAIVEEGNHDELLRSGGHYARLYQLQFHSQEDGVDDRDSSLHTG
ncbi:MAG: ABC transporter ATP-binding protein [bacterium]|nr:ABC transporter ATP-binding protein [bacterium]